MPDPLPNPYEKFDAHRSEVRVGHGVSWMLTCVFLLLCAAPPFWRNVNEYLLGPNGWTPVIALFQPSSETGTLREHLRMAEAKIEDASFTEAPRRGMQGLLTATLREGNRKTAIGADGWLYFRPAISALTGYGPLKPEPDTVAKDPNRAPWNGPLETIVRFNEQLDEYGVELILMPIPVKPMILTEPLTGRPAVGPVRHRDTEAFYELLRGAGVEILDVSDEWHAALKEGEAVFLKQDTHWTPATMRATARRVAAYLKQQPWFDEAWVDADRFTSGDPRQVSAPGDLVENLDLPESSRAFSEETAEIIPVRADGAMSIYDPDSPLVLLGDSFTNIFHQEDMGWGTDAGFAEHLSRELGLSLDTIAQNGQASTGVRRNLATRPGAVTLLGKKKAVIWAIAARDLFLSETVARDEGVTWEDVEFQDTPLLATAGEVRIRGRLVKKSSFQDPATAPYSSSLFAAEYEVVEVLEGDYPADTALVFHWAFRDRRPDPAADYPLDSTRELTLIPLSAKADLQGINQANDSDRFDLTPLWAEQVDAPPPAEDAMERAARVSSLATALFCLVFGGTLLLIYRKKRALRASRGG